MTSHEGTNASDRLRRALVGGLLVVAMFSAYKFASGGDGPSVVRQTVTPKAAVGGGTVGSGGASCAATNSGACTCCPAGSQPTTDGVTGPRIDETAARVGGVQTITVKVTTVYSPNVIHLAAGVPASITFSQAQGCASRVQSRQLGFSEDLSAGSKSVTIENPRPGTYGFECGMNMVHGKILVE